MLLRFVFEKIDFEILDDASSRVPQVEFALSKPLHLLNHFLVTRTFSFPQALLRPGRLDRIIYVPLPDNETRQEIFDIKLRSMPIAKDVNVIDLVEVTEGYSGAEIQAICHEAAMKALEEDLNAATITKEHFKAALAIITPRTPLSLIDLYSNYLNKMY